jgi:hypothetical protein
MVFNEYHFNPIKNYKVTPSITEKNISVALCDQNKITQWLSVSSQWPSVTLCDQNKITQWLSVLSQWPSVTKIK